MIEFVAIASLGLIPLGYGVYSLIWTRGYCAGLRYAQTAAVLARRYGLNQEKLTP